MFSAARYTHPKWVSLRQGEPAMSNEKRNVYGTAPAAWQHELHGSIAADVFAVVRLDCNRTYALSLGVALGLSALNCL